MRMESDHRIPFRHRLTVRLTAAVILALLLIGTPFALAFHRLLRTQQLGALEEATNGMSRVVVDGLRSAMVAGEPHLLDEAVRNLSKQQEVERVMLLDHQGRVRVSSDRVFEGRVLDRERDETCVVCHRGGAKPPTTRTVVTRESGRRTFRAMSTIPNEPQCHRCHDATASINGILLMDLALSSADRRFFADIGGTLALGTVMVLLTIAVLVWLLRRMVHSPLQAVVSTSQRIVEGELDARAFVPASGEFGQLASQVNRMTDYLAASLRTVETQRRELQEILDAVDDEIVVLDPERRIVAANKAFTAKFDASDAGLTGSPCRQVSVSNAPCAAEQSGGCPVQRVFETGRLNKGIVSRPGSDGKEHTIEIHASPLRDPDGAVTRAVEVRRDISERRQMEAILAHSEHLASLGLLASGLSHEINNPLGAIATSVDGLRRRLSREPGISGEAAQNLEKVLVRIAHEVRRGRAITHRLLKVARPPGGTRSVLDVNHVVQEILALLSHDIRRSGIVTRLELAEKLPTLLGDEARLGQVVMNLTLNAIQAMARNGGELRIATTVEDGAIRLEVEDTGCGVAPELLKRIFEPFFTTKPVGKGTGLGLFITHQIVTDLGGTINVRSRPDQGAAFSVRIPRDDGDRRP